VFVRTYLGKGPINQPFTKNIPESLQRNSCRCPQLIVRDVSAGRYPCSLGFGSLWYVISVFSLSEKRSYKTIFTNTKHWLNVSNTQYSILIIICYNIKYKLSFAVDSSPTPVINENWKCSPENKKSAELLGHMRPSFLAGHIGCAFVMPLNRLYAFGCNFYKFLPTVVEIEKYVTH